VVHTQYIRSINPRRSRPTTRPLSHGHRVAAGPSEMQLSSLASAGSAEVTPLTPALHTPSRAQPATTSRLVPLISPPTRTPRTSSTASAPMSSAAVHRPGAVNRSSSANENVGRTAPRAPGLAASNPALLGRGTGDKRGTARIRFCAITGHIERVRPFCFIVLEQRLFGVLKGLPTVRPTGSVTLRDMRARKERCR